ncbi:hypothetical protein HAX54_031482, partial [Datura stramonium]|nr:hypothetical protein [Datura stramonium]
MNNQNGNVVWDYVVLRDDINNLQRSIENLLTDFWALRDAVIEGLRSIRALIERKVVNPQNNDDC